MNSTAYMKKTLDELKRLIEIMDELRAKCPWDREQTNESLRNLTIEETYELADAILNNNNKDIKSELGDLLLHIVFYAKIASEENSFTLADVAAAINKKLIFRHPHVFGEVDVKGNPENVKKNWEELKMKEGKKRVLGGVPGSLPAMIKANRIQEKVRAVGFDWDKRIQIWDKVKEELKELKQEIETNNKEKTEEEFGDFLFSIINAARLYGIDPETALEKTNLKFIKRFNFLEDQTIQKGRMLKDMNLDEMNEIWEEAKKLD